MFANGFLLALLAVGQAPADAGQPDSLPPAAAVVADGAKAVPDAPKPEVVPAPEPAGKDEAPAKEECKENGNGHKPDDRPFDCLKDDHKERHYFGRLMKVYYDEFFPDPNKKEEEEEAPKPRRIAAEPWSSPPFPGHDFQGYPLLGIPPENDELWPLQKALDGTSIGDWMKEWHLRFYGWLNGSGNWSTSKNSNTPPGYWIVPNRIEPDQEVFRLERQADTNQTDHFDWGFRYTIFWGMDYRYTTGAGYFSDQLLKHNLLYGWDPIEIYNDFYFPIGGGLNVRVGRYISPPDIETQMAPDNYLATHSILFTFDIYTQTGILFSYFVNKNLQIHWAIDAGSDMAPWYKGATPTGYAGIRYTTDSNRDSFFVCENAFNDARFRKPADDSDGHDNLNYVVGTWTHKLDDRGSHTNTEAYFMYQKGAFKGGSVSQGPIESFGGGGGPGAPIPGWALDYGVLNYTEIYLSKQDFFSFRTELWNDPQGERTGIDNLYSSVTVGITHNFNKYLQVRPEIGWYHAFDGPAFDLGTKPNMVLYGLDATLRF